MPPLQKAIGILGGTFDPIHFGHLRLAIELYEAMQLAAVHIIPCNKPVHRIQPIASASARFAMLEQACANEPTLIINDCEIRRGGPSYCIDTLLCLQETFPHTPLCLLMGIDTFLGFQQWHRFETILEIAHLIVAHRPFYPLPHRGFIAELLSARLQQNYAALHHAPAGHILLHSMTQLDISATDIRKRVALAQNPRYLLPDTVYNYIQQHHIYRNHP